MANPLMTDKAMGLGNLDQKNNTWAPPSAQPINDGPVSRWDSGIMTVGGTASATLMLLVLILASATVTWLSISAPVEGEAIQIPVGWVLGGVIVGLIAVITATFKPHLSRIAAPVYAIAEGVVLGAISRAFEQEYDGIVLQAVGATVSVFAVMLLLYRSQVIRVTERFRRIVMGATLGLVAFYFVSFIFSLFGATPSFINGSSGLGIIFRVFLAGVFSKAAMSTPLSGSPSSKCKCS